MKNYYKNNKKGITLVALVITLVILLIIAGVSISAITKDNGLITKTKEAIEESRAKDVEEAAELWKIEQEKYQYGKEGKTLEELINDLINNKLLTEDEKDQIIGNIEKNIEPTYQITIGNTTIVFKEKTIGDILKIGDYVEYIPEPKTLTSESQLIKDLQEYSGCKINYNTVTDIKQESLNWRVLDINDGKVRLISDKPTNSPVSLRGYNGYNNAVYLLNEACNILYSGEKGVAKNLKIEDITEKMTYDYTTDTSYGKIKEVTASDSIKYPSIFALEKKATVDGVDGTKLSMSEQTELIKQNDINSASKSIKSISTIWYKKPEDSDFIEPVYNNLFIKDNTGTNYEYWISSRCFSNSSGELCFDIRFVNYGEITANHLYWSYGSYGNEISRGIRPVVTLNSNVELDTSDTTRDGSQIEKAWKLK